MSADEKAFIRLRKLLLCTKNPQTQNNILELWFDWAYRATEWDAQQWGLLNDPVLVRVASHHRQFYIKGK